MRKKIDRGRKRIMCFKRDWRRREKEENGEKIRVGYKRKMGKIRGGGEGRRC